MTSSMGFTKKKNYLNLSFVTFPDLMKGGFKHFCRWRSSNVRICILGHEPRVTELRRGNQSPVRGGENQHIENFSTF